MSKSKIKRLAVQRGVKEMTTPLSIDTPEFLELMAEYDRGHISRKVLFSFINAHTEKVRQEQMKEDKRICVTAGNSAPDRNTQQREAALMAWECASLIEIQYKEDAAIRSQK